MYCASQLFCGTAVNIYGESHLYICTAVHMYWKRQLHCCTAWFSLVRQSYSCASPCADGQEPGVGVPLGPAILLCRWSQLYLLWPLTLDTSINQSLIGSYFISFSLSSQDSLLVTVMVYQAKCDHCYCYCYQAKCDLLWHNVKNSIYTVKCINCKSLHYFLWIFSKLLKYKDI